VSVAGAGGASELRAVRDLVRRTLAGEGCRAREVSVVFVSNPEIRRLNRRFLNHSRYTDVISFPVSAEFLGEIYVSRDQARLQAAKYGVEFREELLRLVLHGLLHLLGYQHREMPVRERRYLKAGCR
jgi:probable rRNA maturation factor